MQTRLRLKVFLCGPLHIAPSTLLPSVPRGLDKMPLKMYQISTCLFANSRPTDREGDRCHTFHREPGKPSVKKGNLCRFYVLIHDNTNESAPFPVGCKATWPVSNVPLSVGP